MNAHESDKLRGMLARAGFVQGAGPDTADIVIFQTCSIRDTAARKTLTHISQAKKERIKNKRKQIICVIGCLSAHKQIPGVDIVLGTNQLEVLVQKLTTKDVSDEKFSRPVGRGRGADRPRFGNFETDTSLVVSSVIITHGCGNFCSYCIVPYVRGPEYSRDIEEIVADFSQIKDCGKVIYLLGQNVNSYRCPRTGADFVGLLDKLCALDGSFVLNFMSSHPKDFTNELIDCIARNPKIERNIHLPMQSGSNKILKLMNRKYTVEQYLEKITNLRETVSDVRITTDIICGFPGETEADFDQTVQVVKQVKFNAAFIFAYSPREGTVAADMEGQLDDKTKRARATNLLAIQRQLNVK